MNERLVQIDDQSLEELRPLWLELYAHHRSVAPGLEDVARATSAATSWDNRKRQYLGWLSDSAFCMAAACDGITIGYAFARTSTEEPGSWEFGSPVGVLETLIVRADHRGNGVGRGLVRAAMTWFAEQQVTTWTVSALAANVDTLRFYEQLGQTPFTVTLVGRVSSSGVVPGSKVLLDHMR